MITEFFFSITAQNKKLYLKPKCADSVVAATAMDPGVPVDLGRGAVDPVDHVAAVDPPVAMDPGVAVVVDVPPAAGDQRILGLYKC